MTAKRGGTGRGPRSGTNNTPTRRQWLTSAGILAGTVLAGCSEGDPGSGDGQENDPAETTEPDDTEPSTETETEAITDTPDDTETEAGANCAEVVPEVGDSVEVAGTMEHPEDGTVEVGGRMYEDAQYYEFVHSDGTVFELYMIDDDYYTVTEDGCFKFSEMPDGGYSTPEDEFQEDSFWEGEEPDRTEVLDGEEMVVYEFAVESAPYDYELTVYVNCATRRIHRVDQYVPSEQSSTVAYYENWGGADPVSPPEMDCQEV